MKNGEGKNSANEAKRRDGKAAKYYRARVFILAGIACVLLASAANGQTYTVPGTSGRAWVTGPDLPPGTLIQLNARGSVDVGCGWGSFGPEGTARFADVPGYPAETRFRYGLVARLTASRTDPNDDLREEFSYGERHEYCVARGGHLWFTVNDDDPGNNTGEFVVDLTRASCSAQSTAVSSPVFAYTQKDRTYITSREFRVGETVVLRVENNSPDPIYFHSAPLGREVVGGEDVIVQRLNGSDWVNAVNNFVIDESPIRCLPLRSRMNITRSWTNRFSVPGAYRLQFSYNTSAARCDVDERSRTGITRVYSETFQINPR
jgi:hypothetical protein